MNRMPCSITDDPYYDYSDYIEQEGIYKSPVEPNPDDARDAELDKDILFNALKSSLAPLITPHAGDKI